MFKKYEIIFILQYLKILNETSPSGLHEVLKVLLLISDELKRKMNKPRSNRKEKYILNCIRVMMVIILKHIFVITFYNVSLSTVYLQIKVWGTLLWEYTCNSCLINQYISNIQSNSPNPHPTPAIIVSCDTLQLPVKIKMLLSNKNNCLIKSLWYLMWTIPN